MGCETVDGCMWSVELCPVAGTGERGSDAVGGSRNKRLAERLAVVKRDFAVYIYRRPNESHCTLFVLADDKPREAGGRICPVHKVARNGWYLSLCLIASLMCPHRTGDSLLIFRAKTSPALERGRRKWVLVFRDLTPYSLVFHDVSKESNAFISTD